MWVLWDSLAAGAGLTKEGTKKKARAEYRAGKMDFDEEVPQTPDPCG